MVCNYALLHHQGPNKMGGFTIVTNMTIVQCTFNVYPTD